MSGSVSTIFFDVGNTLLFPDRKRILVPLHERKVSPTLAQWHSIERKTKKEFDAMVEGGNPDHGFWYLFYTHLLDELGIDDDGVRDKLVEATRISDNWGDMRPGTRAALERIGRQYQIGVISNADGKIAALLERDGIADCFRNITDSGLIGKETCIRSTIKGLGERGCRRCCLTCRERTGRMDCRGWSLWRSWRIRSGVGSWGVVAGSENYASVVAGGTPSLRLSQSRVTTWWSTQSGWMAS
jgi:hypothetical protein